MRNILVLIAVAASGTAVPAFAQGADREDQVSQDAQSATQEKQDEEDEYLQKVVCRTERVTGSLTRVNRTCMTRQEWNMLRERTSRSVEDMNRKSNQYEAIPTPMGGGGGGAPPG